MSHYVAVVVTKSPEEVDAALAPYDENLDVEPYREVEGTVAGKADSARSFLLDFPQYVPADLLASAPSTIDLSITIEPGDKTAGSWSEAYKDKHHWADREAARTWLASIDDATLALAYLADDGYTNLRIEGDELVYDSTSNPDGLWDWWSIGGRWRGYFRRKPAVLQSGDRNPGTFCLPEKSRTRLTDPDYATVGLRVLDEGEVPKPGDAVLGHAGTGEWMEQRDKGHAVDNYAGRADQLQWRDVDLDAMREAARVKAVEEYDEFEAATAGLEPPSRTFAAFLDECLTSSCLPTEWADYWTSTAAQRDAGGDDWRTAWDSATSLARRAWSEIPWVRAIREHRLDPFEDPITAYFVHNGGRDAYVAHWTQRAGIPRVLVVDGQWISKGRMGWFGMADDDVTQDEWNAKVSELYAQLDGDLWVTAVDLHV